MDPNVNAALDKIRTVNDDGSITVTLSKPIKVEGDDRSALTFAVPTGKHWRQLNGFEIIRGNGAAQMRAIEVLGAIPPSSSDQLKGPDISKIAMALTPFFDTPLDAGEAS